LAPDAQSAPAAVPEIGGRKDGSEPTRYGDWEKGGRCIDF
jgi:shikimate dehydrogenase